MIDKLQKLDQLVAMIDDENLKEEIIETLMIFVPLLDIKEELEKEFKIISSVITLTFSHEFYYRDGDFTKKVEKPVEDEASE